MAPPAQEPEVEEPAPEEAEVAPAPEVLTESGVEAPEGEPAPVPEASPEQVPEMIAEATAPEPAEPEEALVAEHGAPETAPEEAETSAEDEAEAAPEVAEGAENHHQALHTLRVQVDAHGAATSDLRKEFEEHEHELPDHEHDLPEHEHPIPEHEHEVAEHEHELVPHDHEDYQAALDTHGGDLQGIHSSFDALQERLADRDKEIARLQKLVEENEQTRAALMKEIALARSDREKMTSSLPVVIYDADEKRVQSVNLFASGRGEALEKLLGGLIQAWQTEGKSVDVTGLPPHMAVKVRDDPEGRGFELFPSSMLFLKITSKEREALGNLPPLVSHPEKKRERPPDR